MRHRSPRNRGVHGRGQAGIQGESGSETRRAAKGKSLLAPFWPSALVWSALAASLLVVAYQNLVVFPHFKTEIAELKAPEILPVISLVGGNSRGGQTPEASVAAAHPFLFSVDIPTQDRFSSYTCLLYSPSGSLAWRVEVSPQAAKDTVSIRVPSADRRQGNTPWLFREILPEPRSILRTIDLL